MVERLGEEELAKYREIFSYFDRDGGGSIGAEELAQVMRTFGWSPTEEELKDMVNVIDQDGDGDISFNEFVWLMTRWEKIFLLTSVIYSFLLHDTEAAPIRFHFHSSFHWFKFQGVQGC